MIRLVTNVITDTGKCITDAQAAAKVALGETVDPNAIMHGAFWENTTWFWQTNWLVFECWLLVFIIALMVVVSFFTPAPSQAQVEAITFTSDFKKSIRESWGFWDIVGTLVVISLCACFYWYFW